MLTSKRLVPRPFLARLRRLRRGAAARRLADVRPQPAACLDQQSRTLLPLGHRARHRRWPMCSRRWSRWASATRSPKLALKQPLIGRRWAWAGFWPGAGRHGHRDRPGVARPRLGALHLLPADDRQPVLLHRRRAGGRRLVDLGRADVDQPGVWKRDNPGAPVPLAMFANVAGSLSLGLDRGRRGARAAVPDPAGGARPHRHDRCRAGARVLLLDAARHRLFLADADLHRLLHDRAAGDRRPAVQRHRWRASPSPCSSSSPCRSASTTCSPTRRSAPASSSCTRCSRRWWRCRRC